MLAALLTFQDQSEEVHNGNNPGAPPLTGRKSSGDVIPGNSGAEAVEKVQVTAGVSEILRFSSFILLRPRSRHSRTKLWSRKQVPLKTMHDIL